LGKRERRKKDLKGEWRKPGPSQKMNSLEKKKIVKSPSTYKSRGRGRSEGSRRSKEEGGVVVPVCGRGDGVEGSILFLHWEDSQRQRFIRSCEERGK